jgi:hypothetical protein
MTDTSASNRERYRELIAAAHTDSGLWIAESTDSVLTLPDESGENLILVWPTAEAARAVISARPDLSQFQPAHRTLDGWLNNSTPHLVEDGILVAAYPDKYLNCLRVPANSFARDLSAIPRLQGKDISRLRRKLVKRLRRKLVKRGRHGK